MSWMSNKISWNWRGMETGMSARCSSRRQSFLDVLRDISDDIKLPRWQGILVQRGKNVSKLLVSKVKRITNVKKVAQ